MATEKPQKPPLAHWMPPRSARPPGMQPDDEADEPFAGGGGGGKRSAPSAPAPPPAASPVLTGSRLPAEVGYSSASVATGAQPSSNLEPAARAAPMAHGGTVPLVSPSTSSDELPPGQRVTSETPFHLSPKQFFRLLAMLVGGVVFAVVTPIIWGFTQVSALRAEQVTATAQLRSDMVTKTDFEKVERKLDAMVESNHQLALALNTVTEQLRQQTKTLEAVSGQLDALRMQKFGHGP
jgi:hypothetical protein